MNSNLFFKRKYGNASMYNFDLSELTRDFSFYEFISRSADRNTFDYGGFLVITDNQYVIGYNAGFGLGTHLSSFARFMKDKSGGGNIYYDKDAIVLANKCIFNYITAKLYYEEARTEGSLVHKYFGGIYFTMPIRSVSLNQLKLLRKFYNEYNEDLKYAIKKSNGSFEVSYQGIKTGSVSNLTSLDEVLKYVENNIDYDFIPEEKDEIIIGTGLNRVRKIKEFIE